MKTNLSTVNTTMFQVEEINNPKENNSLFHI